MPVEFIVAGVTYRKNPDGSLEVQDLSGNWQPFNRVAVPPNVATMVESAAQTAGLEGPPAPAPGPVYPQPSGKSGVADNDLLIAKMSLDQIAADQGPGWTPSSYQPAPKMDGAIRIPGQYTVVLNGPNGAVRTVTVAPPAGFDPNTGDMNSVAWRSVGVEETVKPSTSATPEEKNAAVDLAKAQTAKANADIAQITADEQERAKNAGSKWGRVTDKEAAQLDALAAQTGVSQDQVKLARDQFIQNGQIAGGQLGVAQGNLAVAQANQALAERRADIEARLASGALDRDQARLELDKEQAVWTKQFQGAQLQLQQATQTAQNQIAEGQLKVSQGQLAQNAAQAAQTAETAARGQNLQAAASVYGTGRQAQQEAARTGQGLLAAQAGTAQNLMNAPFSAAGGLSRGSAGKYGMLSGGGVNIPPGVIGGLISGAQGLSTAMYGGQSSIDAAIQAIQGIRPDAPLDPMAQAGAALLAQILDKAKATAGVGSVTPPATAAPPAARPTAAAITSPPTTGAALGAVAQPFGPTNQGQAATGVLQGAAPFPYPQARAPEPHERSINFNPFTPPQTAPTVNLYIGGGG